MIEQGTPGKPPAVGKVAMCRVTPEFHDDLATVMSTGASMTDAIRYSVNLLASMYRYAWESGLVPPGVVANIESVSLVPPDNPRPSAYDNGGEGV